MESLAVKHRPTNFYSVVGQENTISILKNQLNYKQIKQAYLFCGGAGTGKTTIARIFAAVINSDYIGVGATKSGQPMAGEIIEIDAASNNGVDNVRDLRDTCRFKPLTGGYKVYIIDEVHMLSTGAFNALLKTLEEPPAHCVFILCTTDPQKIPATILSRVQRFDFKRMTTQQIIDRLKNIIAIENDDADPAGAVDMYTVADDALEYIAKLSNGGMRDAISLLDTCLGYKTELTLDDLGTILGQASYYDYLIILKCILTSDKASIIEKIEQLHTDGKDLKQFIKGLAEFILDLRKFGILGTMEFSSLPSYLEDQVSKAQQAIGDEKLQTLFKVLVGLYNAVKFEPQPKALIEGELLCL